MNNCGPQVIKGTTAIWMANNNVIPLGTFCVEILSNDTVSLKLGDGINKWSNLDPYVSTSTSSQVQVWTPNKPYSVNVIISHNGELYVSKNSVAPSPVFDPTSWRSVTSSGLEAQIETKLSKAEANRNLIENIGISVTPALVSLKKSTYNLGTGGTGSSDVILPLADGANAGAMPPGSFTQIADNTARIAALEGRITVFLVSFADYADPDAPTQAELTSSYKTAASTTDLPFDGVTLVGEETNTSYRYYVNVGLWREETAGQFSVASLGQLGLVMGSNVNGKIFTESDGTMALKGYDLLTDGKHYNSAGLTTTDVPTGQSTLSTNASTRENNYNGFQDKKKILQLSVTESGELQELHGLAVNGVRIDFDHESLVIKTSGNNSVYQLTNGPYMVTSPYASVEMYGNLFIFDELTPGKGIIRTKEGTIKEVTNLGIYCPKSSVNVIRVIGADDEDVCFILNEVDQSITLCVYPDGSYKTCDFQKAARTPQNISDIELLTSLDNKRHSYFMKNSRPTGGAVNQAILEYVLFQLEDCTFTVLDSTSKACDGGTQSFSPGANFGDYRMFWEGHKDADDYEPQSKNVIDTSRADNIGLNKRLPYKTGQWQTESGSVMKNRRIRAPHNGIYVFNKGAQILWGQFNVNNQAILITPEGFIGWFAVLNSLAAWTSKDWREIEIKKGKYAGKRGILVYSIEGGIKTIFIVNTYDGDPNHTVCVGLNTSVTNLHHLSGLNPIEANYNIIPTMPYNDGIRVYLGQADTAAIAGRYFTYFNQSEIAPNVQDGVTGAWTQTFDAHCLDSKVDTGLTTLIFKCNSWLGLEHVEFGEGGGNGTLARSVTGTVSLFFPNEEDTWDGTDGIRPYFVQQPGNIAAAGYNSSAANLHWFKTSNAKVIWNNHLIQCLNFGPTAAATTQAFDYYFDSVTSRIVCRSLPFASGFLHLPAVIDNKHMVIWASDGTTRCVALTWNDQTKDYTITDGGAWLPPRGTNGHVMYTRKPTEEEAAAGIKPKLYFFDVRTARADYLSLTYTEDENGVSTPAYSLFTLPKSMICNHIIAYPNRKILLTVGAADTAAYYLTLEVPSSIAVTYPDSVKLLDVYDISNTLNPSETPDGAYAVFSGDLGYFYVIERDSVTGVPLVTKYLKRTNVNRRIWALPSGTKKGLPTMRFAVGSNQFTPATASSPVTIIERLGGTITDANPNPIGFTEVRDFGTAANAAVRVDLAIPAYIWSEPQLVAGDPSTVRFMSSKTIHAGDAFSQKQDVALLGYNNGQPVYGENVWSRGTTVDAPSEIEDVDNCWFEIGLTKERDSFISTGAGFGNAYKLAEQWEAFETDTAFSVGNVYKGGNKCTVWWCNQITDNHHGSPMTRILIENEIVSSTVNGHVATQYTHMASFPLSAAPIAGGTLTTYGPQNSWGNTSAFTIRKHRIFVRDVSREQNLANWSCNEAPTIIDLTRNLPYAALGAAEYLVARGASVVPVFETTLRNPLHQLYENQIMPGIYYKRDNQIVPNYGPIEAALVPYFEFTDERCSMVFKNIDNTAIPGIVPFTGSVQCSNQREGEDPDHVFMTREIYNPDTGDSIVMCFYEEAGVGKYKDITIAKADEFIQQLSYNNGKMEMSGDTKKWELNLLTNAVTLASSPPYSLAAVTFDLGVDVASLRADDGYKLYVYVPQQLVMEYQGKEYWTIPIADLILRGQTVAEYMTVVNTMRANTIEASNILLQSKYPRVNY